jgi:hypothetical protein
MPLVIKEQQSSAPTVHFIVTTKWIAFHSMSFYVQFISNVNGSQGLLRHFNMHQYPPQVARNFGPQALRSGQCTVNDNAAALFARKQSVGIVQVPSRDQTVVAFCWRNTLVEIMAATPTAVWRRASARQNFRTPKEFRDNDPTLQN